MSLAVLPAFTGFFPASFSALGALTVCLSSFAEALEGAMTAPSGAGSAPPCQQPHPVLSPASWTRDQDSQSSSSQDSGLATLEISPPGGALPRRAGSPATLPLDEDPCDSARRSSTFPRCGPPSYRLSSRGSRASGGGLSAAGGLLNRSDDLSVCSVSSMSTEMSLSNEDILDFTVSSSSSAIVTLETDDSGNAHFSDVTQSSSPGRGGGWSPLRSCPPSDVTQQEADGSPNKGGPLAGFLSR